MLQMTQWHNVLASKGKLHEEFAESDLEDDCDSNANDY